MWLQKLCLHISPFSLIACFCIDFKLYNIFGVEFWVFLDVCLDRFRCLDGVFRCLNGCLSGFIMLY